MSDKQQSATQYFSDKVFDLLIQLNNEDISITEFKIEMRKIEFDSEELFKQQIIEAHAVGRIKECSGINTDGYQYFNETFKTESNGNSI